LVALDQKKIAEKDILRAYKKSQAYKMPYLVIGKSDSSKKVKELIEAYKNLFRIDKLS
jgi:hypothetical protein